MKPVFIPAGDYRVHEHENKICLHGAGDSVGRMISLPRGAAAVSAAARSQQLDHLPAYETCQCIDDFGYVCAAHREFPAANQPEIVGKHLGAGETILWLFLLAMIGVVLSVAAWFGWFCEVER